MNVPWISKRERNGFLLIPLIALIFTIVFWYLGWYQDSLVWFYFGSTIIGWFFLYVMLTIYKMWIE